MSGAEGLWAGTRILLAVVFAACALVVVVHWTAKAVQALLRLITTGKLGTLRDTFCHIIFPGDEEMDPGLLASIQRAEREQLHLRMRSVVQTAVYIIHPVHIVGYVLFIRELDGISNGYKLLTNSASYALTAIANGLFIYCHSRPASVKPWMYRALYIVFVCREQSMIFLTCSDIHPMIPFEGGLLVSACIRLWLATMIQDAPFIIGLHIALVPAFLIAHGQERLSESFALSLVIFSILVCVQTVSMARNTRACIRAELQASCLKQHSKAVDHLLSSMCDGVVHLSEDLEVLCGHQRLAALLLRRDVFTPQATMNFSDIIASKEDRLAFESFIHRPCDDFAQTAHISLKDSNATVFRVQCFHTRTTDFDTKCSRHVIGLCEQAGPGSEGRHVPPSDAATSALDKIIQRKRAPPSGGLSSISEGGDDSHDSGNESMDFQTLAAAEPGKASLWVKPVALEMLRWTPAFVDIVGQSAVTSGASFLDLVVEPARIRFLQKFQDVVKDLLEGLQTSTKFVVEVKSHLNGRLRLVGYVSFADRDDEAEASDLDDSEADFDLPLICLTIRKAQRLKSRMIGDALLHASVGPLTVQSRTALLQL